jgi:NAD(P)-dependent dehydrogenase (short-subunit alcohol dehydrogenase family)
VNQLYPGPIASERIRTVFAAMDKLKGDEAGSTANHFFNLMALERSVDGEAKAKTFPTPADIARSVLFLIDSPAITGTTLIVDGGQHLLGQPRDVMFLTQGTP